MKKSKIKIAVLGTGSIGYRHLSVLNSLGVKTIAIPIRKERKEELKKKGFDVADDLNEAKKKGALGVVICTNTSRHIQDCLQALDLDFCVLCEKPLAATAKESEKLNKKVNDNLFVAYNLRFDEGFQKLFKLAEDLEEIYYIYSECRSYLPDWRKNRNYLESYSAKKGEGGVILDLSHEIDYLNFFYKKPDKICGTAKNFDILGIEEEECASAIIDYKDKTSSLLVLDYLNKNHSRKCLISSTEKTICYDYIQKTITVMSKGKTKAIKIVREENTLYKKELKEFISLFDGKEKKYLCDFKEAKDVLVVVEGWKFSSRSGRKVALKYAD